MRRTAIPIAALALLAGPGLAHATDYRVMGEDERAISVIEAAIKTDSEGHKETVFFIGFSQSVNGPGSTQVISSTILFDCAGGRYKVGASSTFTADMAPIQKGTVQYSWRPVVPESPFSRASAYACKGEALPKADAADVKAVVAHYLTRRTDIAAAAATAAAAAPAAAPPVMTEPSPTESAPPN